MLSSTMPDELREEKGYYAVGGCGGNIAWHTEDDTLEIADPEIMVRDIKVYLGTVFRLANSNVLPFDWRATAKELLGTVDKYQEAAGDLFDLSDSRTAIEGLTASLDSFYGTAEAGGISSEVANDVIMRLARILVPINFTREARFRHDPALPVPALPTLVVATELDQHTNGTLGFAQTQLKRGQNRVVAAMHEARRYVERALN